VVKKRLSAAGLEVVAVRCAQPRRRRARISAPCAWKASRRPATRQTAASCRGRYLAVRTRGRWRLKSLNRRCAPSGAPSATRRPSLPAPPTQPGRSPQPPPAASGPRKLFGFNDNAVRAGLLTAERDAQLTTEVGADLHRLTFDWRWVEPQKGTLRLEAYDEIYRAMRARGVRPLFVLMFAPWWTWEPGVSCNQWAQECRYPPGRAHNDEWRRIARLLATRYPEAAGIEIWNEPNTPIFWHARPDVGRYTELLKEAHSAIKGANPDMKVITGGFANEDVNATGGAVSLPEFTRGVYQHGGKNHMDALGFHTYAGGLFLGAGSVIERSLGRIRGVRDSFGDSAKPLWITESGLSVTDPAIPLSETQQASGLAAVYRKLAAMRDVEAIVFHTLLSANRGPAHPETGYGVLRTNGSPRPAFCAIARERGRSSPESCG
jgi:hypothetical protein